MNSVIKSSKMLELYFAACIKFRSPIIMILLYLFIMILIKRESLAFSKNYILFEIVSSMQLFV